MWDRHDKGVTSLMMINPFNVSFRISLGAVIFAPVIYKVIRVMVRRAYNPKGGNAQDFAMAL